MGAAATYNASDYLMAVYCDREDQPNQTVNWNVLDRMADIFVWCDHVALSIRANLNSTTSCVDLIFDVVVSVELFISFKIFIFIFEMDLSIKKNYFKFIEQNSGIESGFDMLNKVETFTITHFTIKSIRNCKNNNCAMCKR